MKKIIQLLFLILVSSFSLMAGSSNSKHSSPGGNGPLSAVTIKITPAFQVLSSFDPITLQVAVEGVTDLFAASVTVKYDNTVLKLTNRLAGTFLENNPNGSMVHYESLPEIANAYDSIVVDAAILGVEGSSGSGTIFSLTLEPFRGDTAVIRIISLSLRNSNNEEISASTDTAVVIFLATQVNAKIFLEGPYSSGSMLTALNANNLLPATQPYNNSPWNYSGSEQVTASFFDSHSNIVDWVLVEIRTGTAPGTLAGRRAALLTNEGLIVDVDGSSTVTFFVPPNAAYYIVITHRNHLTIMSANSVTLGVSSSSSFYDFTTAQSQAYGTNPMKQLDSVVFGLFAGDANSDGIINAIDRANIWNLRNVIGYKNEDIDLTKQVNGTDRALVWNNRNFKNQLP